MEIKHAKNALRIQLAQNVLQKAIYIRDNAFLCAQIILTSIILLNNKTNASNVQALIRTVNSVFLMLIVVTANAPHVAILCFGLGVLAPSAKMDTTMTLPLSNVSSALLLASPAPHILFVHFARMGCFWSMETA